MPRVYCKSLSEWHKDGSIGISHYKNVTRNIMIRFNVILYNLTIDRFTQVLGLFILTHILLLCFPCSQDETVIPLTPAHGRDII